MPPKNHQVFRIDAIFELPQDAITCIRLAITLLDDDE
jgi:hypothetical protein